MGCTEPGGPILLPGRMYQGIKAVGISGGARWTMGSRKPRFQAHKDSNLYNRLLLRVSLVSTCPLQNARPVLDGILTLKVGALKRNDLCVNLRPLSCQK